MKTQLLTLTPLECDKLLSRLQCPAFSRAPPRVHHRNYTMAVVMLDAGLRVGELVQLRQDQLWYADAPVGALWVSGDQAKNKHERTIPVTIRLHEAIEKMNRLWWGKDTSGHPHYAFYAVHPPMPITARQVQRLIKDASAKSIGREIHPHLLRHTFASRLMRRTSMRVVQELLGHSSITSTQIYTHPNGDDYQAAIDELNVQNGAC